MGGYSGGHQHIESILLGTTLRTLEGSGGREGVEGGREEGGREGGREWREGRSE